MTLGGDPIQRNNATVIGNPDAPRAMVFVHGFGTDQRVWAEVADAFMDDYRVVLLDNVGAGGSLPEAFVQSEYLELRHYAADLVAVCEVLGLPDVVLVGHSVGAMIALLAANRRPGLASRLVLIGASPRYLNAPDYRGGFSEADLNELYSFMLRDYSEWAEVFATDVMRNPDRPHLARDFAECLKSIPPDRALTVLCSIFQSDYRTELPLVAQPTLIIQSQDDIAVPLEVAEYLHERIRGSRLSVIDATGHLPHVSAAPEVIATMRAFLG